MRSGRPLRDGSSSPFPAANRGRGWEAPEGHLCEQRSGDMHEAQVPVSAPGRPCLSPSVWSSAFRVASGSLWLCLSLCLPPQGGHSARAPRWRAEADPAAGRRGRWRKRRLRIYRLRLCVCFSDSGSVRNRRDRQRPPHSAPALWSRGGRGGGPQGCRTHSLAGAEPAIGDSLLGLPRPPQPHRQSLLAPGGTLIGKARSRWHKRDRGSRRWPRGPLRAGARLAP